MCTNQWTSPCECVLDQWVPFVREASRPKGSVRPPVKVSRQTGAKTTQVNLSPLGYQLSDKSPQIPLPQRVLLTPGTTVPYQRALVVIVECLYRSYKPTRPTAAQPTPAMTQSNWIHAVGGGGNKHIRKHPKHRRPPDPTAEPEAREEPINAQASKRSAQTPKRLPFWYARFPSLAKPLPCFTSQAKHAKAQPNRERESKQI